LNRHIHYLPTRRSSDLERIFYTLNNRYSYQKTIYNAAVAPIISNDNTKKVGDILNILVSISRPLGTTPFAFSYKLMITIPITQNANTKVILSMKGISKTPAAFGIAKFIADRNSKSINCPENFNITEKMKPPIVANKAAFEVVFFQKNPKINIAKIPGDTNPVYS